MGIEPRRFKASALVNLQDFDILAGTEINKKTEMTKFPFFDPKALTSRSEVTIY